MTAQPLIRLAGAWLIVVLGGCANMGAPDAQTAAPEPVPVVAPPEAPAAAPQPQAPVVEEVPEVVPVDPLRPEVRIDPNDVNADIDLWARVRQGYAVPDIDGELVRKWEQWYAGRPDYVQRMTERGGRYLFHIVEELERRDMPTDLALLPFVESAYNPQAMSRAKASGMWQFIPGTGRDFALKQNVFRDDRRDVLASTRAALDYLQSLHGMFGDWQLALAAYNWGQGNVQRAVGRSVGAGKTGDYASLRMPDETRNYLPKLQAVKNIIARPQDFGLELPALKNHPYFLSVPIQRDIDVELAARLAGLSLDDFHQLNPQMNKPVILAAGTPQVLLPYDQANAFVRALAAHPGPLASWTAWVAPRTLRTAEAARLTGSAESDLRLVNHIPSGMLVKAGSTLLVPRAPGNADDVSVAVADNAALALAPDRPALRKVTFRAGRRGESVAEVARRYNVDAESVARWNHTRTAATFKAGQSVIVMVGTGARAKPAAALAQHAARAPARHAAATKPGARTATRVAARAAGGSASRHGGRPAGKGRVQVAQR